MSIFYLNMEMLLRYVTSLSEKQHLVVKPVGKKKIQGKMMVTHIGVDLLADLCK